MKKYIPKINRDIEPSIFSPMKNSWCVCSKKPKPKTANKAYIETAKP